MSVLEKTISLLKAMPDDKVETVYAFVQREYNDLMKAKRNAEYLAKLHRGISALNAGKGVEHEIKEDVRSALGILHEYANPELIEQEERAFELRADPFYSAENQARLLAAKKRMEKQNK